MATDVLSWVDPDGGITELSGDITVLEGVAGLRSPPIRRSHEAVSGVPGTRLRSIAHDLRKFDLPVMFEASSEAELRDVLRAWEYRFDTTRGQGQLLVDSVDGRSLGLSCRYVEGLEAVEDGAHRFEGQPLRLGVLGFEADDPYWYQLDADIQTWALGGTASKWFDPPSKSILPVSLGASSISGSIDVFVDGQVSVWPVWTFNGPGSTITVRNNTSGRTFTWDGTLVAGDQLVIDTTPGQHGKTVLLNTESAFELVTSWDLWPLLPGTNSLSVTITDATEDTNVIGSWYPAFLGY